MTVRYLTQIKTTATSSGKHNYILQTKVVPQYLVDKSGYTYNTSDAAYQAGLEAARSAGYEVYRGSNLTDTYIDSKENIPNSQFYSAISSGDFSNIFVGDALNIPTKHIKVTEVAPESKKCETCGQYTITNTETTYKVISTNKITTKYKIAAIDVTNRRVTLVSMTSFGRYPIDYTDDNLDFSKTFMNESIIPVLYDNLKEVFTSSHIKSADVSILSREQVFSDYSYKEYDSSDNVEQLNLFALDSSSISIGIDYWLQDKYGEGKFEFVTSSGKVNYGDQSLTYGIRPVFTIS